MAINWSTLTGSKATAGSIANWINRSDLPTENILLEAEALIYERLRVREMEHLTTFVFDEDADTEPLPANFLDPIEYRPYSWGGPLPYVHPSGLEAHRDADGVLSTGTPSRWSIIGETAYVDVLCSTFFSGKLIYYKRPDALSSSNQTNFLTVRYPTLLRYAALSRAYEHVKDLGAANGYAQMTEVKIQEANASNEMVRRSQFVPY